MKNLLLPIVALCSLMMSCTNNSKPDTQPDSPYGISSSGKAMLADVKLLSVDAAQKVTIADLQDCKIVVFDSTLLASKPLAIAQFEYKDGSAFIDMSNTAVTATQPIEKCFEATPGVVITNKNAKYAYAFPKAVDAAGKIIAPLMVSNVNLKTMEASFGAQWMYVTQPTRATLKFKLGKLDVDMDLDLRQGWNDVVSYVDFANDKLVMRANTLPVSGLQWTNVVTAML